MASTVNEAMAVVRRVDFLPADVRARAHEDLPLSIGHGQTNSQPRTVAAMLELLDAQPGQHVLDVGAGSGWTTALLAHLVGPDGSVVGIELSPDLARWGAANVAAGGRPWAMVREATPGELGAPAEGPYDRILCSAEAKRLPDQLVAQLSPGGVLVIPVAGQMWRVVVDRAGRSSASVHGAFRFVPLR